MEEDRGNSGSTASFSTENLPSWVEPAARAGYAAKGVVYAVIGVLAAQMALGDGGQTSGSRGALREIASGTFGQVLIGLMAAGLAGYVIWRLAQAFYDPEGKASDDDGKRFAKRAFYFISAVAYALLTWYAIQLLMGSGGGGQAAGAAGGSGGSGGSDGQQGRVAELMSNSWGVWLVGAIGVGIVARGVLQLVKAYTESFTKKIRRFDLGPARSRWVIGASRVGLTARGVIFGIIGGYLVYAAVIHDPTRARGLEGALDTLRGEPSLLGGVGVGLVGYAVYQWVKARYRLIGTG